MNFSVDGEAPDLINPCPRRFHQGNRPLADASPSGTLLSKESVTLREKQAAPSSARTPAGESSRKESTEVPKDRLKDFTVPPVGTLFGEGSFTPSIRVLSLDL